MGRKRKEDLSDFYDFDGSPIFDSVTTTAVEKNKPKKQDNSVFTEKELNLLKFVIEYFHSYYYGRDKAATFGGLKLVIESELKKKNKTLTEFLDKYSDEEYDSFWDKLMVGKV